MRREKILDNNHLRTDSRGITRNRQLSRFNNQINIEILDQGYFIGGSQWNQFNVISPFTRVYYMIGDSGWIEHDKIRIDLLPGFMYLIPSNTRINLRTDGRIEKMYFHVNCRFASTDILDGLDQCYSMPLSDDHLNMLLKAYRGIGLDNILLFKGLVYLTLSEFIKEKMPDFSNRMALASQYHNIYAFVDHNLSAKMSAKSVCEALNLSYESKRRQFRLDNGITLNQYIRNRLVQKAALDLLMTDLTVQEIAYRLDFKDVFYFSRLFKQKMEYSPREYRRINATIRK